MKPYTFVKRQSPILISCEHASSRIPKKFGTLGLTRSQLKNAKDLFDPGSLAVSRLVTQDLQASLLYANFSRLVVDANRRLDMKGVGNNKHHAPALKTEVVVEMEGHEHTIPIPMNAVTPSKFEKERFSKLVQPFMKVGIAHMQRLQNQFGHATLVSLHSFYPVYNGHARTTDIDVLFDVSKKNGEKLLKAIRSSTNLVVHANEPWSLKDADGGVFNAVQNLSNCDLLAIDVNNKHLKTTTGIKRISRIIGRSLQSVIA